MNLLFVIKLFKARCPLPCSSFVQIKHKLCSKHRQIRQLYNKTTLTQHSSSDSTSLLAVFFFSFKIIKDSIMETDEVRKKRREKRKVVRWENRKSNLHLKFIFVRFGNGNEGNEKLCSVCYNLEVQKNIYFFFAYSKQSKRNLHESQSFYFIFNKFFPINNFLILPPLILLTLNANSLASDTIFKGISNWNSTMQLRGGGWSSEGWMLFLCRNFFFCTRWLGLFQFTSCSNFF